MADPHGMPVPSVVSSPGAPTVAGGVPRVLVVDGIGLSVPNVEGDPIFTNATGADFTLQPNSPAIGAGVYIRGVSTANPPNLGAE